MNTSLLKFVSKLLILSMFFLPITQASAAMVGTEQVVAASQAETNRDKLRTLVSRADVSKQLQAMGITPEKATERVNAMTDEEVQKVAGKLDSLPAGANGWAWAAGLLIIAVIVWLFYTYK